MKEPLLGPMAALAAGIFATRLVYFEVIEGLMLMTAFLALAAIAEWNGIRRCAHICVILAVLGAGVWTGALHMRGPAPAIEAESGEVLLLQGCVVEPPVFFEDREQFIVELDTDARARVTLNLREGQAPPRLEYGQMVEFDAKVRKPRNFRNPGAFDYEGYLARKNIFWMASAPTGTEIKVLEKPCGSAFWKAVFGLRSWSLTRIEQLYKGDPYHTAMMQAILLGESSKLEKVWIDHFKRTGTYHALVISGIHVTVLAGLLFTLVRRTTMHEPLAFFLGITAAWLYALVAGWSAPVVRAAGGFTMYLAARFFFRRGRILNLLSAVALGFLLFDPEQMFDASFQLSFLSVVAIGVMAVPFLEATTQPIAAGLRRFADPESDLRLPPRIAQMRIEFRLLVETVELWTRLPLQRIAGFTALTMVHICEVAATSLVVQIGLVLPMALYFHRVSLSGLSANLIVAPLLTWSIAPGFVAIFTGSDWMARIVAGMLDLASRIAQWHMRWEPDWRIPDPPLWLALASVASLLLLAFWRRWPAAFPALICFAVIVWHPFAPDVNPGALELTAIDVGQGDSLLIVSPQGKTMLIDAGGIPDFKKRLPGAPRRVKLDIGEDVVSPYLWRRSMRRLDVVALTHAHEDHAGGLAAVIENFQPRELWVGAVMDSPVWNRVRDAAVARGAKIVERRGGEVFDWGGATVRILAPFPDYEPQAAPKNNDSLAMRISNGKHSFLLMGDIERQVEYRLVREGLIEHADVLKVAHHGSKTSSVVPFLDSAKPEIALVSAGADNFYHHPHPEILDRLGAINAVIYRTDRYGLLTVSSDGRWLTALPGQWSGAGSKAAPGFGW